MAKTRISKLFGCSVLGSLLTFNVSAAEIATNTAQMQAMDKITGKVSLIEVPVNGAVKFGSFSILVRSCKTRSPEETPENFAFVDVVDDYNDKPANIFRGWMMSSSPALNAVEHPIYDVWLLKCIDTKVDSSKLLTVEQLKERDSLETVSASERVVEINPEVVGSVAVETPKAENVPVAEPETVETEENALREESEQAAVETNEIVLSPSESVSEDGAPKSLLDFGRRQQEAVIPNQDGTEKNVESAVKEVISDNSNGKTVAEKIVIDDTVSEPATSSEAAGDKKTQLIEFEEEVEEPLDFEAEALKKE